MFEGLETFVAVVEAGSITAAAARLGQSKSNVSETVRALETRLGVRLLDRTTRSLRATEAGQAYYGRAVRSIAEAVSAAAEAQRHQAEPVGTLRVAVFDGFQHFLPLACLQPFLARHPSLRLELVGAAEAVNLVDAGVDLAIRITPSPEDGLIVRRMGTSRVQVAASPGYLAAAGVPAHPADLAAHRLIAYAPLVFGREWRFTVAGRPLTVPVHPVLLANTVDLLREAGRGGMGVVALPDWAMADLLADGELVRLLPDCPMTESGIYAVYPSNRLMAPRVKLFVDHLAREIAGRVAAVR